MVNKNVNAFTLKYIYIYTVVVVVMMILIAAVLMIVLTTTTVIKYGRNSCYGDDEDGDRTLTFKALKFISSFLHFWLSLLLFFSFFLSEIHSTSFLASALGRFQFFFFFLFLKHQPTRLLMFLLNETILR